MIAKAQLDEWKALCEAATPGKWETNSLYEVTNGRHVISSCSWNNSENNAKFIAISRSAMPALIDWCEQLTEALDIAHSNYDRLRARQHRLLSLKTEAEAALSSESRAAINRYGAEYEAMQKRITDLETRLSTACHIEAEDKASFDWAVLDRLHELEAMVNRLRNCHNCANNPGETPCKYVYNCSDNSHWRPLPQPPEVSE